MVVIALLVSGSGKRGMSPIYTIYLLCLILPKTVMLYHKETQKRRLEKMRYLYCHLEIPSSVQLDSSQVEHALNTLLQRHPEVLSNILREDYPENQKPSIKIQLPYISKEERDKILLSLMEESDDDSEDININEIKFAHNDKDDSYYHFFED
jgi:hypothetical protein